MTKNRTLLESRFKNLYLGYFVVWLAISVGFFWMNHTFIMPNLLRIKVEQVESIVLSRPMDRALFDDKTLQIELRRQKIITDERQFEDFHPADGFDAAKLEALLKNCKLVTSRTCMSPTGLLIFETPRSEPLNARNSNFAVSLAMPTSHFFWIELGLNCLVLFIFGAIFGLWGFGVRAQEKFFVSKMGLLTSTISKILEKLGSESSVPAPEKDDDEFAWAMSSIELTSDFLTTSLSKIDKAKKVLADRARHDGISSIVSYATHDIKAPVEEGIAFLRDLPFLVAELSPEKFQIIVDSLLHRLEQALDSFHDAVNSTSNDFRANRAPVSVNEIFSEYVRHVTSSSKTSSLTVTVDIPARLGTDRLLIDKRGLQVALWALTTNTLQEKRDATISVTGREWKNGIELLFQDNGPGIRSEHLEIIFDDFVTFKHGGTGLGLPSVRHVIECCEGTIEARASDSGATFRIWFPLLPRTFSLINDLGVIQL